MRYPFANRAPLRVYGPRFCSLRPLPRPPLRNGHLDPNPSSAIALLSTSSRCYRFKKGPPNYHQKKHAKRAAKLDGVLISSGESELDFSEENLRLSPILQLPTHQELSQFPGNTDIDHRAGVLLAPIAKAVGGRISMQDSQHVLPNQGKLFFRTVITIHFPADTALIATGDSYSSAGAQRTAVLHALAKLRARGLLMLPGLPVKEAFPDETNGLLDVYNYAARYRCVPTVVLQKFKAFRSITIGLPEHDIFVAIRNAPSQGHAEAAAAREFKRQAELYHLSKGGDNIVVRDRYALSTHNAKDFFTFCCDSGETSGGLDVVLKQTGDLWVGKAQLRDLGFDPEVEPEVKTGSKTHAEKAVTLVAALSVIKTKPRLFDDFSKALQEGHGKYLAKLSPRDVVLSHKLMEGLDEIEIMYGAHQHWRLDSSRSHSPVGLADGDISPRVRRNRGLTPEQLAAKSSQLREKLVDYRTRADLESLRRARSQLPMAQYASQVRQIVHSNVYCVIIGATGSGKTTQVPQILLDEAIDNGDGAACNVICTQPRRIAATSVARRVAGERAERLEDTVGYQVRADARPPSPGGSILYCTTGVLLQRLQHAPEETLDCVSHLVIDEVHERDIVIDFLLITLKNTMAARAAQGKKLPRVVLMSATVDAGQFAEYFRNSLLSEEPNDCPTLSVPGRTFPVQEYYLDAVLQRMKDKHGESELGLLHTDTQTTQYLRAENSGVSETPPDAGTSTESVIDWKSQATASADKVEDALVPLGLAATTIAHITETSESGAILVFLPGLNEIVETDKLLRQTSPLGVDFNDAGRFQIIMLHSSMQDSQKTVFDEVPDGCRKIILSTNIAETSVTIPDVRFVVDTGKSREKSYDQTRRITQLQCTWISKSNAKQRAGRAGRVQDGVYYALFTKPRRESMRAVGLPELLRSDLQEICLDIKVQAFKMPVADFLAGAMEPPPPSAVDIAMQNLMSLGAMTQEEELTPLGRVLASLPVHPTLGKMIVLGIIFKCLGPMIILGAAAHDRPLFLTPLDKQGKVDRIKKAFAGKSGSDHIMLLKAFSEARQALTSRSREGYDFFWDNFINHSAFKNIDLTAREIVDILAEAGLIERQPETPDPWLPYGGRSLNVNSSSEALIKALLVAGLYPNLAANDDKVLRTSTEKGVQIHPGSVNKDRKPNQSLYTFNSLSLSNDGKSTYMRDTTSVTPLAALLFGGPLAQRDSVLEMGGWLPVAIRVPGTPIGRALVYDALGAADKVLFLRRLLDGMLASAFDDLASHTTPLSEDHARADLAFRVARVLGCDSGPAAGLVPEVKRVLGPGFKKALGPGFKKALGPGFKRVLAPGVKRVLADPNTRRERAAAPWEKRGVQGRTAGLGAKAPRPPGGGRVQASLSRAAESVVMPQSKLTQSKLTQSKLTQSKLPQRKPPQSKPPQSKPPQNKAWGRL